MGYHTLEEMIVNTAEAIRPSERLTVSQAAAKYRLLDNPGSYKGPWMNDKTPYLVEPMDVLTSRDFTGMVFVGPAQCGKTDMLLNWITYAAVCDPMDMMVVQMSQSTARDFSKRRMDKLFRQSPSVGERRVPGRQNQNVYDTRFTSGMYLTTSWPTINELSGKPIPWLWLTDYDRMPMDVDTNGSPFDLSRKRATTFKRFGMCVAESSPGKMIDDPKWRAKTPHEAPPTEGILSLYNRGDRRRFYWPCPQCKTPFEPDFDYMVIPPDGSNISRAERACMGCPNCGFPIPEDRRGAVNLTGRWIADGVTWNADGTTTGEPLRSDIASFWLKGPAAALGEWRSMAANWLSANEEYEKNGTQEALKTTVNVDQGKAYLPLGMSESRLPENLKERADVCPLGSAPPWTRFLITTIDIQKNRFVCQTHAYGPGGDICVIDRFDVKTSKRIDDTVAAGGQFYWISPHAYLEDWDLLVDSVLRKTYPIHNDPEGRQMQVKVVGCDSGGREGVTKNAYDFWRTLRDKPENGDLWKRFQLVKGDSSPTAPRVLIKFPDSERKDRKAGARGEVPVLFLNTNLVKDQVDGMMGRKDENGGKLTFCEGLPDSFYSELTTEIRTPKGWTNPKQHRNESWDLLVYAAAVALSRHVRIEHIDWNDPPGWAKEAVENDLTFIPSEGGEQRFVAKAKAKYDLASLAERLG